LSKARRTLETIIVDDEPLARRMLEAMLEPMPEIELVGQCRNGREAVAATRELLPDLLILDVRMPGMSGFDVVKELQADIMPNVIFCTAFQRYALDAFDLHAVDYLLKPVDEERLSRAIARALQRAEDSAADQERKAPLVGAIDDIARRVQGRTGTQGGSSSLEESFGDRKLAIKGHDSTVLIDIDDIDWVDAAGDYMCIHVAGETLIMRSTLKNLMGRLDPEKFKRVHRSTLVNLERIVKVTPLQKGEYMLDLDCDQQLKVSRNFRSDIKEYLDSR
jgi:two-component system LytT family response regulator